MRDAGAADETLHLAGAGAADMAAYVAASGSSHTDTMPCLSRALSHAPHHDQSADLLCCLPQPCMLTNTRTLVA